MKHSVLSLCHTDLTQDHEEEDRSKIKNSRTEQLVQLISKVHYMYLGLKIFGVHKALSSEFSVETTRKRLETCNNFLSVWLVKLHCTAQA